MPTAQTPLLSPSLEVAQTVGDTVHSVHLLTPSEPPRISRRWLLGLGAVCLLLASIAFARSVSVSAKDAQAKHQWVEVERRAYYDYRPAKLGIAHDIIAFGGLAGAILCFGAALTIRRRREDVLMAGNGEGDQVAWTGRESFELARLTGQTAGISIPVESVATRMLIDGTAEEVRGPLVLRAGESLRIPHGLGELHFRWTEKPRKASIIAGFSLDSRTSKFVAGSALVHLAVLALLMMIPPDARSMSVETDPRYIKLTNMSVDANEDKVVEPEKNKDVGAGESVAEGTAVASFEGDKGDPTATKEKTKAAIKRHSDKTHLARFRPKDARKIGIVGLISEDYFMAFHETTDFADGSDLDRMVGNAFDGSMTGPGRGPGGAWGTPDGRGISPYGAAWGPVRTDGIATSGDNGTEYASKFGGDGKLARGHKTRNPIIKIKTPNCGVAGCDKALIGRYIRKHKRRIRNCYERALLGQPDLEGTVLTRFLIHPDGKVSQTKASGTGNKSLERCVVGVVSSIRFPVVADGLIASVRYPFVMSQAGK